MKNQFLRFKNLSVLTIILIVISSFNIHDNLACEVYNKIMTKYNTAVLLDLKFNLNTSGDGNSPEKINNCRIIKNGSQYYTKIDNSEVICVKPLAIQLDHQEKKIYIDYYTEMGNLLEFASYKALLNKPDLFKLIRVSDQINKLTINTNDYSIPQLEIEYNPITFEIKKYTSFHQEQAMYGNDKTIKSKITCNYLSQSLSNKSKNYDIFNLEQYIIASNNNYKASVKYKNYKVINYTNK